MSDYSELIAALRHCGNDMECGSCPISTPESTSGDCDLMHMEAADAIEELQAQMPHWISVEERLPLHDERVLVCFDFARKLHIEMGFLFCDGRWYCEGDEYVLPLYKKERTATHWMPLPAPPEEVGE